MTEYVLVGGPADGHRVTTDGMNFLRVPVPQDAPIAVNWSRLRHSSTLTIDVAEYELVGDVYRWEGLIGDAFMRLDVTREFWREPGARRLVRDQARRAIQHLDPTKVIDGIIWRMDYDESKHLFGVVALVGGRRVGNGARLRQERKITGRLTA